MDIQVVNLEQGMPTVEEAIISMDKAIRSAQSGRGKILKLIHGYGSSGRGGAIRDGVQSALAAHQRAGRIKAFVPGEEFNPAGAAGSPSFPEAQLAVKACPALLLDKDYTKSNRGITIVLL